VELSVTGEVTKFSTLYSAPEASAKETSVETIPYGDRSARECRTLRRGREEVRAWLR
jgi:hypothetical protein